MFAWFDACWLACVCPFASKSITYLGLSIFSFSQTHINKILNIYSRIKWTEKGKTNELTHIHIRARIFTNEWTHPRTNARTQLHTEPISRLLPTKWDLYSPWLYTTYTSGVFRLCRKREEKKMRAKKNTATAKCSVSIINSDGSKGISFVFKCFNLLFATFEVGTTFSYCELNFKITKVYNGNGFLSYYYYFVFFLSLSLVFLSTKSPI